MKVIVFLFACMGAIYGCSQSTWWANQMAEMKAQDEKDAENRAKILIGCEIMDIGEVGSVQHVIVVKCANAAATTTSEQSTRPIGKIVHTDRSAAVRIDQ